MSMKKKKKKKKRTKELGFLWLCAAAHNCCEEKEKELNII